MAQAQLKPLPNLSRPAGPSEGVPRVWKWVFLSGVAHVVIVAALLIVPIFQNPTSAPPPVYTVDLVGGEKLGGGAGTALAPQPKSKPAPEAQAPEEKIPPPVKETKKKEPAKPTAQEIKEAKAKAEKAEMLERIKAKKEAEQKQKAELEAKRKAEAEEEAARKARAEEVKKKLAEARLQDIREKIKARDAAEKAAAEKAAADRAAADKASAQLAKSTLPGDTPGAPTIGPGGSGGGIQASPEFIAYRNVITNQVRNSWTWVGKRSDLKVEVNLSIKDNGEIASMRLVGTSGDRSFDDSVLRAIKRASPLPPPPEMFRKDFSDVNVRFSSKDLGG